MRPSTSNRSDRSSASDSERLTGSASGGSSGTALAFPAPGLDRTLPDQTLADSLLTSRRGRYQSGDRRTRVEDFDLAAATDFPGGSGTSSP